jgi:hypothetical protein
MMSLREDDGISLKEKIQATIHELHSVVSSLARSVIEMNTYTHIERGGKQHGLLDKHLEGTGENVLNLLR